MRFENRVKRFGATEKNCHKREGLKKRKKVQGIRRNIREKGFKILWHF